MTCCLLKLCWAVFCLLCNKSCLFWSWIFGTSHLWSWCYCLAASWGCSAKKVFLEISRNSRENTCTRVSSLIKLQAEACKFIKNEPHRCFLVNFAKFLRTPFLSEHLRWLLLIVTIAVLAFIAFNYFLEKLLVRWYVTTGFSEKAWHYSL